MTTTLTRSDASIAPDPDPPRPRRRGSSSPDRYAWQARGFVLPALIGIVLLTYVPFLWTTWISLTRYSGLGSPRWVGLDNYAEMFSDPNIVRSAANTALWVVGTIVVPVGLGLFVAVVTHGLKGGVYLRIPFLIPYAISGVAVGVVFKFILQNGGALTEVMTALHLPGADSRWLLDWPLNTFVMIGASAWQATGVNALLFVVGLQSIPREPLEAARLDGASGARLFGSITWPMIRPLTTVVVGLAIVGSLKTFDIVWTMTQGGPGRSSETFAVTMYKETFVATHYGLGSAVALVLTLITMVASVVYIRAQLAPKHDF